jgi:1,4-alpha-glucan branching enzyme
MAIKKQFAKSRPVAKVTFSVEAKAAATAAVIGDFNGWDPKAGELGKLKNGTFKGTFEIPSAASYEFKYLVDGAYLNDPQADAFQWNDFAGAENSVIAL